MYCWLQLNKSRNYHKLEYLHIFPPSHMLELHKIKNRVTYDIIYVLSLTFVTKSSILNFAGALRCTVFIYVTFCSFLEKYLYSKFLFSCIIFLQLVVIRHLLLIQNIVNNLLVINNLETAQFSNHRPGLTWIRKFIARNNLTPKNAEKISSAWKSNTSNSFLIYDFYDQLKSVSYLHLFMNILTKLNTSVSKLLISFNEL